MCGRFTLTRDAPEELGRRFGARVEVAAALGRFNVAPTETVAVVAAEGERRRAHAARFGLLPPWARDLSARPQPFNARVEGLATARLFAPLAADPAHRCLVLADGWFEWLRREDGRGARQPFRYTVDGGAPFAFAGLWARRRIGGEEVAGAAIVTCPANGVCRPVHDRMPAVLASPDDEAAWLAGAPAQELCLPLADARVQAAPAHPRVNRSGLDDEGPDLLVAPVGDEPGEAGGDAGGQLSLL